MTPVLKCVWFLAVFLIIGDRVDANSLDKRAIFTKTADKDTYYNIYTKINTIEKVESLEEAGNKNAKKRTKLVRQMLQSVIEMDGNQGLPNKSVKKNPKIIWIQKKKWYVYIFYQFPILFFKFKYTRF